jgi:hypothetical protein
MSTLSECHKKIVNGEGKCSVPMWCGGMPAGFCDQVAYGYQEKEQTRHGDWIGIRFRSGYCSGLACYNHGGPAKNG